MSLVRLIEKVYVLWLGRARAEGVLGRQGDDGRGEEAAGQPRLSTRYTVLKNCVRKNCAPKFQMFSETNLMLG